MALDAHRLAADFASLLEADDDHILLAEAALTIARIEYPGLAFAPYLATLNDLAARVQSRVPHVAETRDVIAALNTVLFDEEGFSGNCDDYYDPRNSFLNDVLERKTGIPITLALVYLEVARRVGFPLFGVGMPGHFLLKHYDQDGRETFIDAFNSGRIMTADDCQRRLDEIYAGQMALQPHFLMSMTRRQILTRMLNNLKGIYLSSRKLKRALAVVDMVLAIYPRSPEDVRQRAGLRYNLGQLRGAVEDLETYLKMLPEASDADEIRQTVLAIRRGLVTRN
ncbi:MAG TPA: transglutaminase-like domain-containing protein [Terriglobales bacterium]